MKKLLILFFLLVCTTPNAKAQKSKYPTFRNSVTGGFSHEIANSNAHYFTYYVEYTRLVKNRLYWGITASFRNHLGRLNTYCVGPESQGDPYNNTLSMDIPTLTGMVYYELPIAKWLAFRGGAGIGIGYHIMKKDDADIYKDKIAPYFQMKLQWVVRPWQRMEICLAPLLFGPSIGAVAPWVFGPPSDKKVLAYFNVINIQIGFRF